MKSRLRTYVGLSTLGVFSAVGTIVAFLGCRGDYSGFGSGGSFINSILVVDLDDDGNNDLVVTLDRSGLSGLSNDALDWFRNTR